MKYLNLNNIENWLRYKIKNYQQLYDQLPIILQNFVISLRGFVLYEMRYSKIFWNTLNEIISHDQYSESQLIEYQQNKMSWLLQHAYNNTVYYKQLFEKHRINPTDIRCINDLQYLPVLKRDEVKQNFNTLLIPGNGIIKVHTSGTSGSGLPIAYTKTDLAKTWAFIFRQLIWADAKPGQWRITMFGAKIVPEQQESAPFWRFNLLEKQILLSIYHLSKKNSKDYIHFLENHKQMILEGFASVLGIMADLVIQAKTVIPMKMVYSTGEPLNDITRQKLEQAFQCKVYDCYGMTEWVGLIQDCEEGNKHLISDYGLLEILDEDDKPVKDDEEGYLVWTGLQREQMPLIRYKIGDKGKWKKQKCRCGRPYPLVDTTITRESDIIVTPDDKIYSPRVINQYLKDKTSFQHCQFIQSHRSKLSIHIVPGAGNYVDDALNLRKSLTGLFSDKITIDIIYSENPISKGTGKYPLIISQLN